MTNWALLIELISVFAAVFCCFLLCIKLTGRIVARRFANEFGSPHSEESVAQLSENERARWFGICAKDYEQPFRKLEIAFVCFNYPSIILLSVILRRGSFTPVEMFFVTGTTYVSGLYLLLNR